MLHTHKKSINVKDYIINVKPSQTPTQQIQRQTIQTTRSQNTKQQSSRYLSQKYTNTQQNKQHEFLSKIRASNHKNRYRNGNNNCNGSDSYTTNQFQSQSHNQYKGNNNIQIFNDNPNTISKQYDNDIFQSKQDKNNNNKQIIKINRITTYSPFDNNQPQTVRTNIKDGFITHYSHFFDKQSKQSKQISHKIINSISIPKQTKYAYLLKKNRMKNKDNSLQIRNKSNTDKDKDSIKNCAKIIELKTNFSRSKIFEQYKQQLQEQMKQQTIKLSPYQIAIKRKNINLIKLKLNSLGQHVNEQQKNNYDKLHKLLQQNQNNIQIQAQMKQKCQKIRQIRIKKQNNRYIQQQQEEGKNHNNISNNKWNRSVTQHEPQLSLISKSIYLKQMQETKGRTQKLHRLINRKNKSFSIQRTQSKGKELQKNRKINKFYDKIMPENQSAYATISH